VRGVQAGFCSVALFVVASRPVRSLYGLFCYYDGFVVMRLGRASSRDWWLTAACCQGGALQVESCQHVETFLFGQWQKKLHSIEAGLQHVEGLGSRVASLVLVVVCDSIGV